MKIISARNLPDKNKLNEDTIGDTHSGLHVALANVDKGMEGLGLTPGELGGDVLAGRRNKEIDGWRNITLIFGKSGQDIQNNNAANLITLKLKRVWYERNVNKFTVTSTNTFGIKKILYFTLKDVVSEPQVNQIFEILAIKDQGVGAHQLDNTYKACLFKELVANRQQN